MEHSAIAEVERQHVFIEAWMSGHSVPDVGWQDFERSLGSGFTIVGPSGTESNREALIEGFHGARGVMPGVVIEIRNSAVLHDAGEIAVVRYEEWQLHPTQANQRVSTAVFAKDETAPLGWAWLSLHETTLA